jgi:signal transduction histidine kinase
VDKKNIKRPRITVVAAILVIIIYLIAFININYVWSIYKKDVERNMIILSYDIDKYVTGFAKTIETLVISNDLKSLDARQISYHFQEFYEKQEQFEAFLVTDAVGNLVWYSSITSKSNENDKGEVHLLNNPLVSDNSGEEPEPEPGEEVINLNKVQYYVQCPEGITIHEDRLMVSYTIINRNIEVAKIIGLVSLEQLHKEIDSMLPYKASDLMIFDNNLGRIYDRKDSWADMGPINQDKIIKSISPMSSFNIEENLQQPIKINYHLNNVSCFYKIPDLNWFVVASVPFLNASSYNTMLITQGFLFLLITFLITLLPRLIKDFVLREKKEQFDRTERLVLAGELASTVAHEVRNPITAIKGFIQLISRRNSSEDNKEIYNLLLGEIDRAENIITEFLAFAKPSKPNFIPMSINEPVNIIFKLMESQASLKNIQIQLSLDKDDPKIHGDSKQLRQVLINIVKNSIEAMENGGNINISTGFSTVSNKVVLTVEDNGSGIPPSVLKRLGEPFITTKERGTGLGLASCFSIIMNHGGTIEVDSDVGRGTIFTIKLDAV